MHCAAGEIRTAVVLVGGEGTRLRPLTERIPKPVLPVLGRPLLSYTLDTLRAAGVERAILACGYLPDEIVATHGHDYEGLALEYKVEPEPLGTGGAIKFAADGIDETFIALNGDTLREAQLRPLLEFHRERDASVTMLLVAVADPSRYGVVELEPDGRVEGFVEKPPAGSVESKLVNAGVYVLEPDVLDLIEPGRPVSIERDVFPLLANQGGLYGLELPGYWLDIGTPQSFLQAHCDLLERHGGVNVAAGADISSDAELVGPVAIERGVRVESGARVGPLCYLAPGSRINADATVERAIVLPEAAVGLGDRVHGAIVSPTAVLACG